MDKEYIPAIITAIAGIVGVFINVGVNVFYRYRDEKERLKQKNIDAYQSFYAPLYEKLTALELSFNDIVKEDKNITINDICKHLAGEKTLPAKTDCNIKEFYKKVEDTQTFISSIQYQFYYDYKLKAYYDSVCMLLLILVDASKNKIFSDENNVNFDVVIRLRKRISGLQLSLFSKNIIMKLYHCLWSKRQ